MDLQAKTSENTFIKKFSIFLSIALIITGICYIIAACHLFFTGGSTPYTRERVGEYLIWLAIPSIITVFSVIFSIVYGFLYTDNEKKEKIEVPTFYSLKTKLKNIKPRFDSENAPEDIKALFKAQKNNRLTALLFALFASLVTVAASAAILLDFDRFTVATLNADIVSAVSLILLLVGISLLLWCVYTIVDHKAAEIELKAIKDAAQNNHELMKKAESQDTKENKLFSQKETTLVLRIFVLIIAICLIGFGIANGGMTDVLSKAVKICTECIGLG